jgi:hypothetical protein
MRIIVFDKNWQLIRVITEVNDGGAPLAFVKPTGIFADENGILYICDEEMKAVIKCDADLNVLALFGKPESNLITGDFDYKPNKIIVDSYGKMYIQAVGVFQGLISLKADGTFIKYFGANRVEMTFQRQLMKVWKTILADSASDNMQTFNPIEYANIFLAGDDFIYATCAASERNGGFACKINPLGIIITSYGISTNNRLAALADISVDADENVTFIEEKSGCIYQIDKSGSLMFAFGGIGDQLGLFRRPTSLIETGGKLYVLDGDKNDVTRFGLTEFGEKVHLTANLYSNGMYVESVEPLMDVIRSNTNYLVAYNRLGKAYFQLGQYEEAMHWFKLANSKASYSEAWGEYALETVRAHFSTIVVAAAAVIVAINVARAVVRKRRKDRG